MNSSAFPQLYKPLLTGVLFLFFLSCTIFHSLPLPLKKPDGIYHTVKKGQTLWRICKRYDVNLQNVAELNNIKTVSQIKTGDKIFIPGAKTVLWVPPTTKKTKSTWKKPPPKQKSSKSEQRKIVKYPGVFQWPVKGSIVSGFGINKGMKHDGINIKTPLGTLVKASNSGKVIFSSLLEGYGNTIIIQHKNNYATVYANNRKNIVKKGKWVKRGQNVAEVGVSSEKNNVPYLHFQIRKFNRPRNPLFYLPKK